jgi:hypothetical protein
LIQTKALDHSRDLYHHCDYFFVKGLCDLGDQCSFIHAVFKDPISATNPRLSILCSQYPTAPSSVEACLDRASSVDTEATTFSTSSTPLPSQAPSDSTTRVPQQWWYRDPHSATRVYVNI